MNTALAHPRLQNDLSQLDDPRKTQAHQWFHDLRDQICSVFETIEQAYAAENPDAQPGKFKFTSWDRAGGGGGIMGQMKGCVFEKVGVNVSTVHGEMGEDFRKKIPGGRDHPFFWASGISLVAHMCSPLVPAVHMNTRHIETQNWWYGGGADLTPYYFYDEDTADFHNTLKRACDLHDPSYYPRYKKWCDEYFFLKHRNEPRGIGGIFYDDLKPSDWRQGLAFTQDVGRAFLEVYPKIVQRRMFEPWTEEQRKHQLKRRGRYVEFNLLYDRGTKFGLQTGGNIEAILMSLPPKVEWP